MPPRSFASALATAINPPPVDVFGTLGYQPTCVPFLNGQITEPCGQCPHELLAADTETHSVLLGGSAGGGKTLSLLMYAIRACVQHPGLRVAVFRRSYPELRESVAGDRVTVAACLEIPALGKRVVASSAYIAAVW